MTTRASLASTPPKSSGLTPSLNDALYAARAAGRPMNDLVVVGLLRPAGHGEKDGNQSVTLVWERLEVLRAGSDANEVRELIAQAWEHRHSLVPLPIDFKDQSAEDQRRFLLGAIEDRQKELDLTDAEVGAAYREHFGIDPSLKDKDTPAGYARPDYKKAAPHHLREFALTWGALRDEEPREEKPSGDDATDEVGSGADRCQMCGATDKPLSDGLCPDDAKNVGLRTPDQPSDDQAAG